VTRPSVPIHAVAVGIPARDEAATVGECIRAALAAIERCGLPASLVVAADRCTDATAALARSAMAASPGAVRSETIDVDAGSAGAARHAACARAVELLGVDPAVVWLATTDADSRVPGSWLAGQLALAGDGADGVAGLVVLDRDAPTSLRQVAARHQAVLGDGDGHPHVYGANLGVRADLWLGSGGFPPIEVGEDHAAWAALRAGGARLMAVADIVVETSGRLCGRAPDGFASVLAALDPD